VRGRHFAGTETDTEEQHRAYFIDQIDSTREFWRRFGHQPSFDGRRMLEIGCGHGALSIDAANRGATVLGLDIDADRIEFAERQQLEPGATGTVEFRCADLADVAPQDEFDIAVSKDTFEHVDDVAGMAAAIYAGLKSGGELWAGFSPLYYSPFGDHERTGLPTWMHAFLPESMVLRAASKHNGRSVRRLYDIGLNGLTAPEFLEAFAAAGFEQVSVRFNAGDRRGMGLFSRLRRIPPVSRFFTVGFYGVFRRP
jgi:SAM-dependent methyltransferase